jgi:hypothetical protein
MTASEKYAAIVALLKDENGNWKEDVNGGDLVQDVSLIIDAPDSDPRPPISAAAQNADRPWCYWTLGFAEGSDWDTASHYGFGNLVNLQFRLTTADGRSRPVQLVSAQFIDDRNPTDCTRQSGIEVTELDTENYEPKDRTVIERVPYEDIREVIVF